MTYLIVPTILAGVGARWLFRRPWLAMAGCTVVLLVFVALGTLRPESPYHRIFRGETRYQPLAELISTHVWKPMGAEYDANITVDEGGFVLADHGMSSTLRDLTRVGLLVLNKGKAFGKEVVPADFITDIFEQAGDPDWPYAAGEGLEPYYRSFWWGEGNAGRDVSGVGIHGQFVRVVPEHNMVITLYSTWPRADGDGTTHGWDKAAELQDAIIKNFQ